MRLFNVLSAIAGAYTFAQSILHTATDTPFTGAMYMGAFGGIALISCIVHAYQDSK